MTDIVDDLREYAGPSNYPATMLDAADEITRLRAENERMREALEYYVCTCQPGSCAEKEGFRDYECGHHARAALTEPTHD